MHELIGIIVKAEDKEDAEDQAQSYLNQTLRNAHPVIDYGMPNKDGRGFGDKADTSCVVSDSGQELIDRLMGDTEATIKSALDAIREGLMVMSNDDIWADDTDGYTLRYHMSEVGSYGGPAIRLYDEEWSGTEGIRSVGSLDGARKGWTDKHYIVPMDIHF
jgi:hypothetical protein